MLIAVLPSVELPLNLMIQDKQHSLTPTCEVPDSWGAPVVADKNNKFFKVTKGENGSFTWKGGPFAGKVLDIKEYHWTQLGKNAQLEECTKQMNAEQFQVLLDFARNLAFPNLKAQAAASTVENTAGSEIPPAK